MWADAVSRLASVSIQVLRSVSAWALPRPSASASAESANSTVNQSQKAITPVKAGLTAPAEVIGNEIACAQDTPDLDHKHDRIAPERRRVEFDE